MAQGKNKSYLAGFEFLWVSGISLTVVGATKIWTNAWGIFWAGVVIMLVGIIGKTLYEK